MSSTEGPLVRADEPRRAAAGARPGQRRTAAAAVGTGGAPPALLAMADYYGTLAAVRSLGRAGVPVHVAEPQWLAPGRWSRYTTRASACPSPEGQPERFLDWLLDLGRREPGHVLLPTNDELAWLVARHRPALARDFHLGVPSFEAMDTVLNKWRLTQACAAVGVPTPDTWLVASDEDLPRLRREVRFPVLVKPQTQVFLSPHSKGQLVAGPDVLAEKCAAHAAGTRYGQQILDGDPGVSRPLLQAFVDSRHGIYGLSGFVDESGELFVAVGSRKLLQRPRKAGVGLCFEEDEVLPELADQVARLCRHVRYHGVFEVEFLETDDGRHLLIDFNPRFYGQMALEVDRGIDLPLLAYRQSLGDHDGVAALVARARSELGARPPRVWCNSIQLRTFLALGRLSRAVDRRESQRWRAWLAEHRRHATDAVTSPGDPGPALAEIALTLRRLLVHPRAMLNETRG